ncbi:MAG: VTC domain-containing protein [Pseudobacteriovorax sp.]|nr:VTC domain-containing protein [Pseudobacteriovorax sp.]
MWKLNVHQNYNEYKFHVANESLAYVRNVLDSLHGHSDPFPEGVVDSIYYDTSDLAFYNQCLNGDPMKTKFRIRGYGDGAFHQMHLKRKDLFTVAKKKQKIKPVVLKDSSGPVWNSLASAEDDIENFIAITSEAEQYGPIMPVIRVKYHRYRYRVLDYRITLDTNVEVSGFDNGLLLREKYGVLPDHVLEVKTVDPRPHLPLLGLIRLPQISYSKFLLGLNLLITGDSRCF